MRQNIKTLRGKLSKGVKICAVLKANAYSLGDVAVAGAINSQVDCFAVANIREAERLRGGGITKPILLLGVCEDFPAAIRLNLTVTISHQNEMRALLNALNGTNLRISIHIKVNTGMNRYGISGVWHLRKIIETAVQNPNISVDGLYTHMAFEADSLCEIDRQLKRFVPFRRLFRARFPHGIIHAACSGSAEYAPAQFDMVRIGKIFYGGFNGYRTALTVTCQITATQSLPRGARIGYNGTHTLSRPSIIGVVPCGYADLTHFNFGNTGTVIVGGHTCRVLGRICMDSFFIDVTDIHKPLGQTVTIIGDVKGQTLMEISRRTKTIACNLLCSMNFNRTDVVYKG